MAMTTLVMKDRHVNLWWAKNYPGVLYGQQPLLVDGDA